MNIGHFFQVPPELSGSQSPQLPPLQVRRSLPPGGQVERAVILLHGQTHSGNAIRRGARREIREALPNCLIDAVDAPYAADPDWHDRAERARAWNKSFCWFELPKGRWRTESELAPPIRRSVDMVHAHIDRVKAEYGLREDQIYLVGFSQGGAIATQAAIERERPVAGVYNLCGLFFDPAIFGMRAPRSSPPIFYAMVQGDEIIKAPLSYHALTVFKQMHLDVMVHVTPGQTRSLGLFNPAQREVPSQVDHTRYPYIKRDQHNRPTTAWRDEYTAHWVNPQIKRAMAHHHATRTAEPQIDLYHINQIDFPRVTLRWLKLGWMMQPVRRRPVYEPNNAPTGLFNRLSAPLRKSFERLVGRSIEHIFNRYRDYLFEKADIDITPGRLEAPPQVEKVDKGRRRLFSLRRP